MHVLDCYSLATGQKIAKPYIMEKFFPLNMDRFIALYPYGQFDSRAYDHWPEVIRILFPILQKEKISVVQIGPKESRKIEGCIDLTGQVAFNQCAYIVNKSELLVSVDAFPVHMASAAGKKSVSLYSDSPPEVNGPYWNEEDSVCLVPEFEEGCSFSYAPQEENKSINTIKPENIAKSVCDLLGIEFKYPFKTIYKGQNYQHPNVEYIPSENAIDISDMRLDSLIVRMDLFFNESLLLNQLRSCSCSVITDKPISLRLLEHFKSTIPQFVYLIGDTDSKQYVQDLYDIGIECLLMTDKRGEDLEKLKFKYLDYGQIHLRPIGDKKELNFLKNKNLDKLYYKSSTYIIKDAEAFYSQAAIEANTPVPSIGHSEPQKIIDTPLFWKESENFILLEKD